jgi:serine/threonine protein kinase
MLGFHVLEHISKGATRVVIAREPATGKLVAVKLIEQGTPKDIAPLVEEARKMFRLDGIGVLPLEAVKYDVVTPTVGLVTPFCTGGSLRQRAQAGELEPHETVHHLLAVACALARLHGIGVIHGDIKPDNVLFLYDHEEQRWGTVVGDFGLTTTADAPTRMGFTSGYAPPEVLLGARLHSSSDVWAWGVMACELIGREHPFAARMTGQEILAQPETSSRYLVDALNHLASKAPSLTWLTPLLVRCTAADPSARPDAAEIVRVFEPYCAFVNGEARVGALHAQYQFPFSALGLELRHYWGFSGFSTQRVTAGWLGDWSKAQKLLDIKSERSCSDALERIARLVGTTEDSESPASLLCLEPKLMELPVGSRSDGYQDADLLSISGPPGARHLVIRCMFTGLLAFVDLVESHRSVTQRSLTIVSNWADLAWRIRDELDWSQWSVLGQVLTMLGRFEDAEFLLTISREAPGDHVMQASAGLHELCLAKGDMVTASELAHEDADRFTGHHPEMVLLAQVTECMDLVDAGIELNRAALLLRGLPREWDYTELLMLVLLRRFEMDPLPGRWETLRYHAVRATAPRKVWLALECTWEYDGPGEAMRWASALCEDPLWQLPRYAHLRGEVERVARGDPTFPRTSIALS